MNSSIAESLTSHPPSAPDQFQTDVMANCAIDWSSVCRRYADSPTFHDLMPLLQAIHDATYLRACKAAMEIAANLGLLLT